MAFRTVSLPLKVDLFPEKKVLASLWLLAGNLKTPIVLTHAI